MAYWLVLIVGIAALLFIVRRLSRAYALFGGMHVCACPLDGTPAMVKLDVWRAALGTRRARRALKVTQCTRWPERASCPQTCLAEVDRNCHLIAQFQTDLVRERGNRRLGRWPARRASK